MPSVRRRLPLLCALFGLTFACATAESGRVMTSTQTVSVRVAAEERSDRIGRIEAGVAFHVFEQVDGASDACARWGRVGTEGWACLDWASPSSRPVERLPVLLDYQPPDPADFERYVADGSWTRPVGEPILPFVYGRVWRRWKAPLYPDVQAFASGAPATGNLPAGRRARFLGTATTERGVVLVRGDGTVVPEDEVYLFPITRFQGRDLQAEPVPSGHVPAWVIAYDGLRVDGPSGTRDLPYHTFLAVKEQPEGGRWIGTIDGVEVAIPVASELRVWRPSSRPEDVGEAERWIDVDTQQQTLGVLVGDELVYATLVSTGLWSTPTPLGGFRITDKQAWNDMRSRPGSAESYHVEAVPWVMHFRPRYALHAAYWHWGFGRRVSHGCINLAPRDAAWLYTQVGPEAEPGWHSVWATERNPGTVIRVR